MPTLIWEGDPADLTPAERYEAIANWDRKRPPKVGGSERYLLARLSMTAAFNSQWSGPPMFGPVLVVVTSHWPFCFDEGPCDGLAAGRLEAVHTATLNALLAAGVLQRAEQARSMISNKHTDAARPRIEVEVKHWDDGVGA